MRYYGLANEKELFILVDEICKVLGYGMNGTADELLIETAGAETNKGLTKDNGVLTAGIGLTQFDKGAFEDTKNRSEKYRQKIKNELKVDINLVEWEMLAYSPFLALLFTRLKYKLIPEEIPLNIEDRAKYWKKYYNTMLGAGTIEHYLKNNNY